VQVCDCRTPPPIGSHLRMKVCLWTGCTDISAVQSWAARVGEKRGWTPQTEPTKLTRMLLKSLSKSITMSFRQKQVHKTDISHGTLSYRNVWARLCTPIAITSCHADWAHQLSLPAGMLTGHTNCHCQLACWLGTPIVITSWHADWAHQLSLPVGMLTEPPGGRRQTRHSISAAVRTISLAQTPYFGLQHRKF
jgi:hypothetical protein